MRPNRRLSAALAALALLLARGALASAGWGKFIPADYPWLRWSGRAEFRGPEARFDWSQVTVRAEFEGEACAIYLDPLNNNFNAFVDGKLKAILGPSPKNPEFPGYALWIKPQLTQALTWVLQNLGPGSHVLELNKRTGPNFSLAKFYGLRLDSGAVLKKPSPAPERRIEFIGDSYTNGYGCEAGGKKCAELRPYENGWKSYAALAARELNADFQVLAVSGLGVVRNYGDRSPASAEPMPSLYGRVVSSDAAESWPRSRFEPQAIVINLGSNDFSTKPAADEQAFLKGYQALVDEALEGRPKTPVFIVRVKEGSKLQDRCLAEAAQLAVRRGIDATLVEFDAPGDDEMGCDWHPNEAVHRRWAGRLSSALKAHLGW